MFLEKVAVGFGCGSMMVSCIQNKFHILYRLAYKSKEWRD
jgi:hypothetical protein